MSEAVKFPIVGIGASAGGIPAMEGLFRNLSDKPGAAFVIVTHLSPERESLLHEVVGRYTQMPVQIAQDDMTVECDNVYVMPSNAILTIKQGRLRLRRPSGPRRERKPVDIFLGALAEDHGEYSAAIILSGGDADGTLGAKLVKERGGLTIAQAVDGSGPARRGPLPAGRLGGNKIRSGWFGGLHLVSAGALGAVMHKVANVLVVEDEWLIAEDHAHKLRAAGHRVVGPYATVRQALEAIERETVEVALLDFELRKETSFAVAERLKELNIPFAFISGVIGRDLPPAMARETILPKPLEYICFIKSIDALIAA